MNDVVRRWAREPRSATRARAELRKALAGWGLTGLEYDAMVVLSELVTNAVRHATGPGDRQIETRFSVVPRGVRIEVHDACATRPEMPVPDDARDGGRGLFVVSSLADRWAVGERDGVGKRVWAELWTPATGGVADAAGVWR
ncbi:ATP-binding protein [Streptomyces sp. NPDC086023]|uniref:ATP-binding protein n=1 Tax=Streptomyces sp. NPDC086023 TaxID=3365746 RepID=UPI0037D35B22